MKTIESSDNILKLNSIKTDSIEIGKASEYENTIDRFVVFAIVDFDINEENHSESVVFDCGQSEDVAMWENYNQSLFCVSDEQDKFLADLLQEAGKALSELKRENAINEAA